MLFICGNSRVLRVVFFFDKLFLAEIYSQVLRFEYEIVLYQIDCIHLQNILF